jgi:hypothetical protein
MKREKIIKELQGQKKHINLSLSENGVDRTQQDIFMTPEAIDAYWYGRLVSIEELLRLLEA